MSKSPLLLVLASFIVAVAPRPASAQTPLDSRHQLGLLNEVLADTVTQRSGTHPVKAPHLKLTLVPGALPVSTGGDNMSVAVLDIDGDGDLDLVLGHSNGYPGFSSVLRNDGRGRFTSVADSGLPAYILVMARGDLDNDGRCDLVIATDPRPWYESQPSTLRTNHRGKVPDAGRYDLTAWRAVGDGRFEPWPLTGPQPGTAAAAAWDARNRGMWLMPDLVDVDHDGRLDLVVSEMRPVPNLPDVMRSRHWLLLNRGDRLEAMQVFGEPPVVDDAHGVAVAATFDVDGDGWTDLTCLPTSGFFALDVPVVWYRNRDGRFADIPDTLAIGHEPKSYAPCWYDVDSDGDLDLLALQTDAQGGRNDVYLDDGAGRWRRLGAAAGLWGAYSLMSAPVWADLDQDGLPDLVPCLSTADVSAARIPVRLNLGGGRFGTAAEAFTPPCVAGLAVSTAFDVDGDLDLDVVIAPRVLYAENGKPDDHPAVIYRNDSRCGSAIMISLVGTRSNRSAIGARVEVQCDGKRQARIVGSGGLNGTINPPLDLHFGLGRAKAAERIVVKWPSGIVESWDNLAAGRRWTLSEGSGTTVK